MTMHTSANPKAVIDRQDRFGSWDSRRVGPSMVTRLAWRGDAPHQCPERQAQDGSIQRAPNG
jgi:hypothetical protein